MLMSNTYTLHQVAQDLKEILAKKRDVRRTTTQERPAIKPQSARPTTDDHNNNHGDK